MSRKLSFEEFKLMYMRPEEDLIKEFMDTMKDDHGNPISYEQAKSDVDSILRANYETSLRVSETL